MNDLISRQAAIDALIDAGIVMYNQTGDGNGMVHAINVIKGLPSAEPEIIQCKNCKHFSYDVWGSVGGIPLIVGHEMCDFWGGGCKTNENGWCSFAERKNNG